MRGSGAASAGTRWTWIGVGLGAATLAVGGALFGCAAAKVSDLSAYEEVPMNRVVPYPAEAERRDRAVEVVIVDRPSGGLVEGPLPAARAQARRDLEAIAAEAGAVVIDPSLPDPDAIPTEGGRSELEGGDSRGAGAELALVLRFSKHRDRATWTPPFRFPWQSEADVAEKAGTCTHVAEIDLEVQLIEIGANDRVTRTFSLAHAAEQESEQRDRSCPIAPVSMNVLFETAIEEATSCLRIPLGRRLRPRGHVTAHRKAPAAERHLFRVSLGTRQGIDPEDAIEIRREQRSERPSGEESRSERVIARGVATDHVTADASWIVVEPAVAGEILKGDVVRPVLEEGLLSSLSGPDCDEILEER